jgi:hypothetical protein
VSSNVNMPMHIQRPVLLVVDMCVFLPDLCHLLLPARAHMHDSLCWATHKL